MTIHIDGEGPMRPESHGQVIHLAVVIGYPGSKISDILIGGHKVQVPNEALRLAAKEHDDTCDTEGG